MLIVLAVDGAALGGLQFSTAWQREGGQVALHSFGGALELVLALFLLWCALDCARWALGLVVGGLTAVVRTTILVVEVLLHLPHGAHHTWIAIGNVIALAIAVFALPGTVRRICAPPIGPD